MKVKIEFDCKNAVFEENAVAEVSAILRNIGDAIERACDGFDLLEAEGRLLDSNGNTVGTWEVKE